RGQDLRREGRTQPLEQHHGAVRADAEERAGAEVHVAGIAAEDVPGGGEHHELQHDVAGKEEVLVHLGDRDDQCQNDDGGRADPEGRGAAAHRPNSPCGVMPSTTSSSPNATAGAQDAPARVSTIDSEMPRISPAISVPVMLPSPANTTTQNVRPM